MCAGVTSLAPYRISSVANTRWTRGRPDATVSELLDPMTDPGDDVLRPVMHEDGPGVVDLVVAAGMFTQDDAGFL